MSHATRIHGLIRAERDRRNKEYVEKASKYAGAVAAHNEKQRLQEDYPGTGLHDHGPSNRDREVVHQAKDRAKEWSDAVDWFAEQFMGGDDAAN